MRALLTLAIGALLVFPAAADKHKHAAKPSHSPSFEKLKSLVGTWSGKMKMEEGNETGMQVVYRLVAGGSVLEERSFPGTPMEMVTMYHDQGGELVMTHYCMLGNQPRLALKKAEGRALHFDFDPSCGIDVKKEMHMHSLVMSFVDKDTVKQTWTMFAGGKAQESHPITLKRVKEK